MSARHPLIHVAHVRRLLLEKANERAARIYQNPEPKFTRVSDACYTALQNEIHALVVRRATEHWQTGCTLT